LTYFHPLLVILDCLSEIAADNTATSFGHGRSGLIFANRLQAIITVTESGQQGKLSLI
jgi:hypothetical protein